MGSFSEDEECRFFDAQEDVVVSIADDEGVSNGFDYEMWIRSPRSVSERRGTFMKRMGLSSVDLVALENENSVDVCSVECKEEVMDRVLLFYFGYGVFLFCVLLTCDGKFVFV